MEIPSPTPKRVAVFITMPDMSFYFKVKLENEKPIKNELFVYGVIPWPPIKQVFTDQIIYSLCQN